MAIVFVIFSSLKKRVNKSWGIWLLLPLWIAWEHGHTIWNASWTWLTLGNVFAFNHNWVQWYEFTGTSGGTFWILFSNIIVFQVIKKNTSLAIISKPVLKIACIIIVPILFSYLLLFFRSRVSDISSHPVKVVIVQPNIDPYNDKFNSSFESQFSRSLKLLEGKVDDQTDYLVFPETFISDNINERAINTSIEISWFRDSLLKKYPQLKIIVGCSSYTLYDTENEKTLTARFDKDSGRYFDFFNTALQIDSKGIDIYHKSKLVPGAEVLPFSFILKPLENLALDLGGTTGTLGTQKERSVFENRSYQTNNISVAPIICYESVYADYVTGYVRNGAKFLFIITNDGWWENTPGHVQHLNYARLRAIENRRQIARSANTGISCFIDEYGNMSQTTEWWKEAVIEKQLYPNSKLTFFSRFGDLLSYFSVILSILLIFWAMFLRFKSKNPLIKKP